MMSKLDQLLKNYDNSNPISFLKKTGYSNSQINDIIIQSLKPYFENKSFFTEHKVEEYIDTWVNFFAFNGVKEYFEYFKQILNYYNNIKVKDLKFCLSITNDWMQEHYEGVSKFWSHLNDQKKENDFDNPDDYLNYLMQSIGLVIEGAAKPSIKELYHLNKFKND